MRVMVVVVEAEVEVVVVVAVAVVKAEVTTNVALSIKVYIYGRTVRTTRMARVGKVQQAVEVVVAVAVAVVTVEDTMISNLTTHNNIIIRIFLLHRVKPVCHLHRCHQYQLVPSRITVVNPSVVRPI